MVLMYMFAIAEFIFPPTNTLKERKHVKCTEKGGLGANLTLSHDSVENICDF
jgi:hypothetical protein